MDLDTLKLKYKLYRTLLPPKSPMRFLAQVLMEDVFQARWIVQEGTGGSVDFGFRVFGFNFTYYKHPDTFLADSYNESRRWREAKKRELNDTAHLTY
jgi:hypothetical protein